MSDLTFTMPSLTKKEVDSAVCFVAEAVLAIAKWTLAIEGLPGTILFIGASAAAKHGIGITSERLLDTALADMADSLGEIDWSAAQRAMIDARRAETAGARWRHRLTAEGKFRDAYEKFCVSAQQRRANWLQRFLGSTPEDGTRVSHGKAYIAAASVALILRAEDKVGCDTWLQLASESFAEFTRLTTEQFGRLAANHEKAAEAFECTPAVTIKWRSHTVLAPDGMSYRNEVRPEVDTQDSARARSYYETTTHAVRMMSILERATAAHHAFVQELRA